MKRDIRAENITINGKRKPPAGFAVRFWQSQASTAEAVKELLAARERNACNERRSA